MAGLPLIGSSEGLKKAEQGDLVRIALELIRPRADQPRKHFEKKSLERLAASLKAGGDAKQAIQVVIRTDNDSGKYYAELKTGERRFRAAQMAGLAAIKSEIVESASDRETHLDSTIENLNRLGLNYMEMAYAARRIVRDFPEWNLKEIADRLGVSESYLKYCLNFLRLHADIQELMLIGEFDHKIATELTRYPEERQFATLDWLMKHTAREVRKGKRVSHTSIAKDVRKVAEQARIEPRRPKRGKKMLSHDEMTLRRLLRLLDDLELILKEIQKMNDDKLVLSEAGLLGLKQKFKGAVASLSDQLKRIEGVKNIK